VKKKLTLFIMISTGFCFLLAAPCFPQDGEIMIHPTAFVGYNDTDPYTNIGWEASSNPYIYRDTSNGYLVAPVDFSPAADGKRVHRILVRYYDFNASGYVRIRLYKTNILNGTQTLVAELNSGTAAAANVWQTMELYRTDMNAVMIDQHKYAWHISAYMQSGINLRLGPIRIKYVM
jgi:hypothetical protein